MPAQTELRERQIKVLTQRFIESADRLEDHDLDLIDNVLLSTDCRIRSFYSKFILIGAWIELTGPEAILSDVAPARILALQSLISAAIASQCPAPPDFGITPLTALLLLGTQEKNETLEVNVKKLLKNTGFIANHSRLECSFYARANYPDLLERAFYAEKLTVRAGAAQSRCNLLRLADLQERSFCQHLRSLQNRHDSTLIIIQHRNRVARLDEEHILSHLRTSSGELELLG